MRLNQRERESRQGNEERALAVREKERFVQTTEGGWIRYREREKESKKWCYSTRKTKRA